MMLGCLTDLVGNACHVKWFPQSQLYCVAIEMQLMILHTKHTHTHVTSTRIRGQKLSGPDNPLLLSAPFQLPLVSPPPTPTPTRVFDYHFFSPLSTTSKTPNKQTHPSGKVVRTSLKTWT